jgi:hypothetical protein
VMALLNAGLVMTAPLEVAEPGIVVQ